MKVHVMILGNVFVWFSILCTVILFMYTIQRYSKNNDVLFKRKPVPILTYNDFV